MFHSQFIILLLVSTIQSSPLRRLVRNGIPMTHVDGINFLVALMVCPDGRPKNCAHFCTGSLLSSTLVVTAAHCVDDFAAGKAALEELYVLHGSSNANSDDFDGSARLFSTFKVEVHPGRISPSDVTLREDSSKTFIFDIAVVYLNNPVVLEEGILSPLSLPEEESQPCDPVASVGYGRNQLLPYELAPYSPRARYMLAKVLSRDTCEKACLNANLASNVNAGLAFDGVLTPLDRLSPEDMPVVWAGSTCDMRSHICFVGSPSTMASLAIGDSGGPTFGVKNGRSVLVGVTSFSPEDMGMSPSYVTSAFDSRVWLKAQVQAAQAREAAMPKRWNQRDNPVMLQGGLGFIPLVYYESTLSGVYQDYTEHLLDDVFPHLKTLHLPLDTTGFGLTLGDVGRPLRNIFSVNYQKSKIACDLELKTAHGSLKRVTASFQTILEAAATSLDLLQCMSASLDREYLRNFLEEHPQRQDMVEACVTMVGWAIRLPFRESYYTQLRLMYPKEPLCPSGSDEDLVSVLLASRARSVVEP